MKASRLSPIAVAVIGAVICLAAAFGIIYFMIMPTSSEIAAAQARYDAAAPDATPQAQAAAKKQLADAKVQVGQIQAQWAVKEARLMPPFDVSHRYLAWRQLSFELAQNLGPDLEKWFPKTGVQLASAITLQAPPASPNDPEISASPLVIPLGGQAITGGGAPGGFGGGGFGGGGFGRSFGGGGGSGGGISVVGSFRHILNHVIDWNNFNRLVLTDGLSLKGFSPYMTGTYSAEVIIFPQNDDKVDKPIPSAGTGGGPGGGFGGMMGGPPGMMGGPPGMGYPGGPPGAGGPPPGAAPGP